VAMQSNFFSNCVAVANRTQRSYIA